MKTEELKKMSVDEKNKKLKELEMELVKAQVASAKGTGSGKISQIKRAMAQIITLNK